MNGFPDTENLQKIAEIIEIFCQKNIKYETHPNIKSKNTLYVQIKEKSPI